MGTPKGWMKQVAALHEIGCTASVGYGGEFRTRSLLRPLIGCSNRPGSPYRTWVASQYSFMRWTLGGFHSTSLSARWYLCTSCLEAFSPRFARCITLRPFSLLVCDHCSRRKDIYVNAHLVMRLSCHPHPGILQWVCRLADVDMTCFLISGPISPTPSAQRVQVSSSRRSDARTDGEKNRFSVSQ